MAVTRSSGRNVAVLVAATLAVTLTSFPAAGQEAQIPSVDVIPAGTTSDDPNAGQWFFIQTSVGQTVEFKAILRNPASVAQTVKVYLRDLEFAKDGTPTIKDGEQTDIGAWGHAENSDISVPAKGEAVAKFFITPHTGADPGDHIGVVAAESAPSGGNLRVIKRVATRIYVTIPGEATRGLDIDSVQTDLNSFLWPKDGLTTIFVRNTGRVRINVNVQSKGVAARGPKVLLSRHVERYIADINVPWYGGRVRIPVEAVDADTGVISRVNARLLVIPWGLLIAITLISTAAWLVRRWWTRRASKYGLLQQDLRRLETLITQRPASAVETPIEEQGDSELDALLIALKRARRAGAQASLERLSLAFHHAGGKALDELLVALRKPSAKRKPELMRAAASYGTKALRENSQLEALPPEIKREILKRRAPAAKAKAKAKKPLSRGSTRLKKAPVGHRSAKSKRR